jgi:transaldolase / glucose-6-phosphate isomerase
MSKMKELSALGQSIWLDYIRRSLIDSGELQALVDEGLRGVTSNPTIFEKAIAGSADYDETLSALVKQGKTVAEIYETLALSDIGRAADLFRPVHQASAGGDGFVSIEVSPTLADDTEGTVAEARRLWAALGRKNILIKVPATKAGVPAIERLIAEGINVNVTLIFSVAQYEGVANAYIAGLEKRATAGQDLGIASVASFFVSRIDTSVDERLERINSDRARKLLGTIAVANARAAYGLFRRMVDTPRWRALAQKGAHVQRVLWASTGTKNPAYSRTLYVDPLIGPDTVNTLPPATLQALREQGKVADTLAGGIPGAEAQLAELKALGIDLGAVCDKLLADGVASFAKSFESLLANIGQKRDRLLGGYRLLDAHLGRNAAAAEAALQRIEAERVLPRIWARDHTVWSPEPTEITNRLGWLDSAERMTEEVGRLRRFADEVRQEGMRDALLLGMGGSSLAPEVFRKVYGVREGFLDLHVQDSTDPAAVLHHARLDPVRTLVVVPTKSGSTVETLSFMKFYWNRFASALGQKTGAHFVAITDPGSSLETTATKLGFRHVFAGDPEIGGRYSALSPFGLVPAALIGADLDRLLDFALEAVANCDGSNRPLQGDNAGARLGAWIGALAKAGQDKLTFVMSPGIAPLGAWLEQLLAESTGKNGRGILPVADEPVGPPEVYGDDRVFAYLRVEGDATHEEAIKRLEQAGHPVIRLGLRNTYDLDAQMFLWEMATAVAGHVLHINPFDQPNVEAAKVLARRLVDSYKQEGRLPPSRPDPPSALGKFLSQGRPGDYVALMAYVAPTSRADEALGRLRLRIRDRLRLATTVGYGPRFLHSTGQLHKGDAGRGLFVQITCDDARDAPIPDEPGTDKSSLGFSTLKMAQALGDAQALREGGRRVLRIHLSGDVPPGIDRLVDHLN